MRCLALTIVAVCFAGVGVYGAEVAPAAAPAPGAVWTAAVDKPAAKVTFRPAVDIEVPIDKKARAWIARRPSPVMVLADRGATNGDAWGLVDLRTGTLTNQFREKTTFGDPVISADGSLMAGISTAGAKPSLEIWALMRGKSNYQIKLTSDAAVPEPVGFVGNTAVVLMWPDDRLQVIDVKAKTAMDIKMGGPARSTQMAFSPTGRYLAAYGEGKVDLYDLSVGKRLGQTPAVSVTREQDIAFAGIVFTGDGERIAVALGKPDSWRLLEWAADGGQLVTDKAMKKGNAWSHNRFEEAQASFECSPGGEVWRMGGSIYDRKTGIFLGTLAIDFRMRDVLAVQMLDDRRAAVAAMSFRELAVSVARLELSQSTGMDTTADKAADIVAQRQADTLPPAKVGSLADVADVVPGALPENWAAVPLRVPTLTQGPWTLRPATASTAGEVETPRKLLFSTALKPMVGVAYAVTLADDKQKEPIATMLDRIDLVAGRSLNVVRIPDTSDPINLSPDGKQLLTRAMGGRFYVWAVDKPQATLVAGLKVAEHASTDNKHEEQSTGMIINSQFMLTLNVVSGEMVVWRIPECTAWIRRKLPGNASIALSPDAKVLACWQRNAVGLYDALSGKYLAEFKAFEADRARVFFNPSGRLLAACSQSMFPEVRVWDISTRKPVADCVIRGDAPDTFCGDRYLLGRDGALWDLEKQCAVWRYGRVFSHAVTFAGMPLDGRLWSIDDSRQPNRPRTMDSFVVPHKPALAAVAAVDNGDRYFANPGDRVRITINGVSEDSAKKLRGGLITMLREAGLAPTNGEDAAIEARATVEPAGSVSQDYARGIMGTGPKVGSVSVQQYQGKLEMLVKGQVMMEFKSQPFGWAPGSVRGEDFGKVSADQTAQAISMAENYISGLKLPSRLPYEKYTKPLGQSQVTFGKLMDVQEQPRP